MDTIEFKKKDFKETADGFVFQTSCKQAEDKKFAVEGLKPDGSYEEVMVISIAKNDIIEIYEQPFDGRIIYN